MKNRYRIKAQPKIKLEGNKFYYIARNNLHDITKCVDEFIHVNNVKEETTQCLNASV